MKFVSAVAGVALVASALAATTTTASATPEQPNERAGAWKVTAKINKATVVAGEDVIRIKGRVTPKAAGQKVLLQQKLAKQKKWNKAGTFKIKANGTFVAKDKPNALGARQYRIVKPASNGLRQGVSKPLATTVYAWRSLDDLSDSASAGTEVTGTSLAGDWVYPVLTLTEGSASGFAEYTLGRKCIRMASTFAMVDKSPTGTSGSVAISTDGGTRVTHALAIGTVVETDDLDLTDVYRLRFDITATPGGYPAAVETRVLCL